jgi:hypothetical protein
MRLRKATLNCWSRVESLDGRLLFLLLFGLGVTVRMLGSIFLKTYLDLTRYEMERAALSLAHTGRLADPYMIPTGYTAHVAPGYAAILALIFHFFGDGPLGELVKNFVSSAAAAAQYALLPAIVPALGIPRRAGIVAGFLGALLPLKYSTEVIGDWESAFAGLALALLIWATARAWKRERFTARLGAWHGVAWGLAILISSNLLVVLAGVTLAGFFTAGRARPRAYIRYAAALACATLLCLAPWAWRNERRLGALIFTRSNFGLELRVSNNDLATPLDLSNFKNGVYRTYHPLTNLQEAEAVKAMGEPAYNRDRLRLAVRWIEANPARFADLTAHRFLYTWFPDTSARSRDAMLWCETIAAALGLVLLWRAEPRYAALLIATLVSYTAIYCFIQVLTRYRYPIDWILLICGTYFATAVAEEIAARRHARGRALPLYGQPNLSTYSGNAGASQ